MQYCLFMHYQEGPEIGLTEEDMAPAREAFARYADDLDAAGVLVGTQVLLDTAKAEAKKKARRSVQHWDRLCMSYAFPQLSVSKRL